MRMEVITNNNYVSFGMFAKDIFVKNVVSMNEDGISFDVVQIIKEDTLEKIRNLPLECGITKEFRDGAISAFEKMRVGDKYLCVDAWITSADEDEAKFYWKVQELVNRGYKLQGAVLEGNEWLKKYREEKKTRKMIS